MIATAPDQSLGLLTDLYQLTMAAGYWKTGIAEREVVFPLVFRENPFGGGYSVACGLETALDFLARFRFAGDDLDYLAGLTGNDGRPLFEPAFLDYLGALELTCDLDAVPEGTVVFPHEPLVRVRGPLAQCQILETSLLTIVNFQTLIATKAARVCQAAGEHGVIEFGLRRSQGVDGGMSAGRAAYVGGCVGTSNVLAGKRYGIPIMGTHAHSWVMSFPSESESFMAWARALPNNCVFLVDTYDTARGVENAIAAGRWLRGQGHEMMGVRLDSGDLGALARDARRRLDEAGFPNARIVASSDLDEHAIAALEASGAPIDLYGVGTRLATAYDQPALGGVYKLAAWREGGVWRHVIKLSEEKVKVSNPGVHQVRRFSGRDGGFLADVVYDEVSGISRPCTWFDAEDREHDAPADAESEDLLVPVLRRGRRVYDVPEISAVRRRTLAQLAGLPEGVRRLDEPDGYAVGLDRNLYGIKEELIAELADRHQASKMC